MVIKLVPVMREDREILANLLEKYDYEFSQYDQRDVNKLGLYGYQYLDCYWLENTRWAYFIIVDGFLAGFVMINKFSEAGDRQTDFSMAEFFVMHKYRRSGVGRNAFYMAVDLHKGKWQLKRHPKNTGAVYFWDRVVHDYTRGEYTLVKAYPNTEYADGSLSDVYFFDNTDRF